MSTTTSATAIAPANIAFIKYWGVQDAARTLPFNGSVSLNLDTCLTTTSVTFDPDLPDDEVTITLYGQAPAPAMASGYWKLYIDHVLQADQGADLDFLVGQRGAAVPKDNH